MFLRSLLVLPFALPLFLLLLGSLKSPEQMASNPWALWPQPWQWSNYLQVFRDLPFLTYLGNSLILCLGTVIGSTLSCSLAAYSLTRIRWTGRKWLLATVILTLMLPWQITMIPRFVLISQVGLYDSWGAIIWPSFLGDAFYIFLLRQFFLTLPEELFEAGRLDGLGYWGLFWKIAWPLSRPAIVTVALFQFVETWNNFGEPLLYLSTPEKFPIAYGLERYLSSYGDQTHLLLAASVIFSLPLLLAFFAAQKFFVDGLSTSGIKG